MSENSTRQITLEELISSRADSLANLSHLRESEKEQKTNATCGPKCLESFGRFPRSTSWGKTFAGYLIGRGDWYSKRCALTWKLKATKSHRIYFQLAVKTHPTEEIESGLLLTPTSVMTDEHPEAFQARKKKNGYVNGTKYPNLLCQVKYGMLPTPLAQDAKGEENSPSQQHKSELAIVVTRGKTSQLNPLFVEEMMGFPKNWTALPFQSGEKKVSKPTETQ